METIEIATKEQDTIYTIGNANYNISRLFNKEKPLNTVIAEEITSEISNRIID